MAATVSAVGALALVAGSVGGWLTARGLDDGDPAANVPVDRASLQLDGDNLDVAAVVDALSGTVVSIQTEIESRQGPFVSQGVGAGTGIVLDDGYILTNAHVASDARSITVSLDGDDEPRDATLVAADEDADIAVLHVDDTDGLVPASLGSSDDVQVGDDVVAIGNALALEGGMTVTEGIVSATGRDVDLGDSGGGTLSNLVQTDAAISSGNSGGPLVDAHGQVVGINTFVAASSASVSATNMGFAIDIDTARQVASDLTDGAVPA
jgi:S1-C subfamily serine protease